MSAETQTNAHRDLGFRHTHKTAKVTKSKFTVITTTRNQRHPVGLILHANIKRGHWRRMADTALYLPAVWAATRRSLFITTHNLTLCHRTCVTEYDSWRINVHKPLKDEDKPSHIWRSRSYRAVNTLRLDYKNRSVNAAKGNSCHLFWDP